MNGVIVVRTVLIAVIMIGLLFSDQHSAHAAEPSREADKKEDSAAQKLSAEFRQATDQATPGLVTIYTMRGPHETADWRRLEARRSKKQSFLEETPQTASYPNESPPDEQGSGIIVDSHGMILTCNHVVPGADVVFVVLPDGRRLEPVEVYADPDADLS